MMTDREFDDAVQRFEALSRPDVTVVPVAEVDDDTRWYIQQVTGDLRQCTRETFDHFVHLRIVIHGDAIIKQTRDEAGDARISEVTLLYGPLVQVATKRESVSWLPS